MGLGGCGWAEETGGRSDFMDQLLVSREILKFARAKCRTALSSRQTFGVTLDRQIELWHDRTVRLRHGAVPKAQGPAAGGLGR